MVGIGLSEVDSLGGRSTLNVHREDGMNRYRNVEKSLNNYGFYAQVTPKIRGFFNRRRREREENPEVKEMVHVACDYGLRMDEKRELSQGWERSTRL